jgi:HlyD family secretion protein
MTIRLHPSLSSPAKALLLLAFLLPVLLTGCKKEVSLSDAYGNFEATELIVSAEANGKLLKLDLEEGDILPADAVVGLVDTLQLALKIKQIKASKGAVSSKTRNISAQIRVLEEQKASLMVEKNRIASALADKVATPQQMDQINGQVSVVEEQIRSVRTQNAPILAELDVLDVQIQQLEDQIAKSAIRNPVAGTVLVKYAEAGEVTAFGKPLYKIANLQDMILRAYISGAQLPHLKLGQEVTVLIDEDAKTNRELKGVVSWVSPEAEFTPKIIQTKDERVNMVYAIKVRVANPDGATLKIGMPGEVRFMERTVEAAGS